MVLIHFELLDYLFFTMYATFMDQHPLPQDISSFEFHLIGDMTLKQFIYLGSGLGIAYLIFVLFATSSPYLAWPLIALFSLIGAAFAFLPIMERPLDHWLIAFVNAIFHPTKFEFQSKAIALDNPYFDKRLALYLGQPIAPSQTPSSSMVPPVSKPLTPAAAAPLPNQPPVSATPAAPIKTITLTDTPFPGVLEKPGQKSNYATPKQTPQNAPGEPEKSLPSKEELKKTVELAKQAQTIQSKILETEDRLNKIKVNAASPGADSKAFTEAFQTVLSDLQDLNKQASKISNQLAHLSKTPAKVVLAENIKPSKPNIIPSLTLTSVPNIINGIVTDAMGNYVEGAIVVAHDKQGLPVRALKSNKLGQFIAATPLPSGTYNLTVEKDNLNFDTIQVGLKDAVMPPVVIAAKRSERIIGGV